MVCITDPLSCFGLHMTVIASRHTSRAARPLNLSYQSVHPRTCPCPWAVSPRTACLSHVCSTSQRLTAPCPPALVPPGAPHIHSGELAPTACPSWTDGAPALGSAWGGLPVQRPSPCPAPHWAEFARGRRCQSMSAGEMSKGLTSRAANSLRQVFPHNQLKTTS